MSDTPIDARVVLVTAPTAEIAAEIARTLVEERLCACGNIVPGLRSIYAWKGQICDDAEVLLVLKTRADRMEAVRQRVVELHPYEVPEVLALPVKEGHEPYLAWIGANVDPVEKG